jgi:hypothetical protein
MSDVCPDLARHAGHWVDMQPHTSTVTELARGSLVAVEMGTRGGVSAWAILDGLPNTGRLVSVDIDPGCRYLLPPRITDDPRWSLVTGDSAKSEIPDADLVFIDTSHTLEQTRAELSRCSGASVIVLHDWSEIGVRRAVCEFITGGGWLLTIEPSRWGLAILRRLS